MSIINIIKAKLSQLQPVELEIIDQSKSHQEHLDWPSEVTHISIKITSMVFNDLTLIQRHKKVYDILKEEIPQIHAVSLFTKTTC